MDRVKLLVFMDSLRYERKINQETFLSNIVSQRQYYRYIKGESEPNFEIITLLAEKLSLPIDRLINMFESEVLNEKKLVKDFFNLVLKKDFEKSQELYLIISKKNKLDTTSNLFLKIGKSLSDFYQGKITKINMIDQIKKACNYKILMKNNFLHDIELYSLGLIMEYSQKDREEVLQKILTLMKKSKIFTGGNRLYVSQIYFWILKNLGRLGKYDELIDISSMAIDYSNKEFNSYLIEYVYYYKALAHYRLGKIKECQDALYYSIHKIMMLESNIQNHFRDMIYKDFGYDMKTFYQEMLSSKKNL